MSYSVFSHAILNDCESRGKGATWPGDKYPDMPELKAKSRITLLDENGPGVVCNLHASYMEKAKFAEYSEIEDIMLRIDEYFAHLGNSSATSSIIIRFYYDGEDNPSIEVPLMDFFADIQCSSNYFSSIYFSKVKYSHNFRLPIPFGKHIRIELENPTDDDFTGYSEIQWDKVPALPDNCGYLFLDYREGSFHIPFDVLELCNINRKGAIAAHWLQLEADNPNCANGVLLCEGNIECYLDGSDVPSVESLGTEDYYGYSWGFNELQSDFYTAILRKDTLMNNGSRIALLRCRDLDKIRFNKSCRIITDYTQEYFSSLSTNPRSRKIKLDFAAQYRSCFYYYALK